MRTDAHGLLMPRVIKPSKKKYPTQMEVDKYYGLINSIAAQMDELLDSPATTADKIKTHFRRRNKSVALSNTVTDQDSGYD